MIKRNEFAWKQEYILSVAYIFVYPFSSCTTNFIVNLSYTCFLWNLLLFNFFLKINFKINLKNLYKNKSIWLIKLFYHLLFLLSFSWPLSLYLMFIFSVWFCIIFIHNLYVKSQNVVHKVNFIPFFYCFHILFESSKIVNKQFKKLFLTNLL